MGGNFHLLQGVTETSSFSLDPSYDHVNVVYDGLNRVSSAAYFRDAGETQPLESFAITYSASGDPIYNGTEWKNHIFDIYRGRFVVSGEASTSTSTANAFTQVVRATATAVSFFRFELISNTLNQVLTWPSAAEKITIESNNVNDTLAGTGIQTIEISGIDASGAEISETISMSGTTPVITLLDYKRLNSVIAITTGVNEFSMGTISFTNASLQLIDTISPGFNRTRSLKFTVPTSNQLTLKALRLNGDRLSSYEVKLMIWERASSAPPYVYSHTTTTNGQSDLHIFPAEVVLTAETDVAAVVQRLNGPVGNCSRFNAELIGTQTLVV